MHRINSVKWHNVVFPKTNKVILDLIDKLWYLAPTKHGGETRANTTWNNKQQNIKTQQKEMRNQK